MRYGLQSCQLHYSIKAYLDRIELQWNLNYYFIPIGQNNLIFEGHLNSIFIKGRVVNQEQYLIVRILIGLNSKVLLSLEHNLPFNNPIILDMEMLLKLRIMLKLKINAS